MLVIAENRRRSYPQSARPAKRPAWFARPAKARSKRPRACLRREHLQIRAKPLAKKQATKGTIGVGEDSEVGFLSGLRGVWDEGVLRTLLHQEGGSLTPDAVDLPRA